jgi:hypothetical protein
MKTRRRDPVPLQTWPRWDDAPSLYGLGSSEQSAPQLRSNFASAPGLGSHVRRCIHRDWAHLIAVIRRNDGAHGPCIGHRHSVWCTAASGLLAGRIANRPDSTPGSRRRPKDSSKVPLDRRWKQKGRPGSTGERRYSAGPIAPAVIPRDVRPPQTSAGWPCGGQCAHAKARSFRYPFPDRTVGRGRRARRQGHGRG